MERKVVWTKTAKNSLSDIKKYLLSKFTQKEFDKLKIRINEQIAIIQKGSVQHVYNYRTDTYKEKCKFVLSCNGDHDFCNGNLG